MQAQTKKSKVTLTNWERLPNSPLPLAGASAVQWNDYVFVLANNGMALLYHTKSKIWSALPRSPYNSYGTTPPALTLHNGQILTMSMNGEMATFDPQLGNWRKNNEMNLKPEVNKDYTIVLASYNLNLYAIIADRQENRGGFIRSGGKQDCCTIFSLNSNSKWAKICELEQVPLRSVAIVDKTAFVYAGEKIHKMFLKDQQKQGLNLGQPLLTSGKAVSPGTKPLEGLQQSQGLMLGTQGHMLGRQPTLSSAPPSKRVSPENQQQPKQIASPPYKGFALYTIKDTLFSFGGRDRDNQPTSDVLRYNPDTDTWESAGYMRSARYNVAVTTMQDTTLDVFVLGGSFGSSQYTMEERIYNPVTQANTINPGFPPQTTLTWTDSTSILEMCTVN